MDPRHPELALPRVKELIKQYEDLEKRISKATVSNDLGQLEREGVLVVQELCLVAPRLHETLMNASRNRRTELANGIVEKPVENKLTKEEEKDFERLKGILAEVKKKFNGKSAKNKETGVVYDYLRFMTVSPYPLDNIKYGIIVSIGDGKEEISFYNDEVTEFLNNYEPVEEKKPAKKKPAKKGKK